MKIPSVNDIESEDQARDVAIEYQSWFSEQSLTWGDIAEWYGLFETLGKKYGLTEEFKENGIL